jgi:ribosome modulation factor
MELKLIRPVECKRKNQPVSQPDLFGMLGGARPAPGVNCLGAFNDGRSAAWAGTTLASCPYPDPLLARAWVYGWRAGQAEQRGRHA